MPSGLPTMYLEKEKKEIFKLNQLKNFIYQQLIYEAIRNKKKQAIY